MASSASSTPSRGIATYLALGLGLLGSVACAGYCATRGTSAESASAEPVSEVELAPSAAPAAPAPEVGAAAAATPPVARLRVRVHASHPHDPAAFTQGLVYHEGRVFESTGLVGRSSLREVRLADGEVLRRRVVDEPRFAEGLALVGDELVQITWQDHVAFVYGRDDFATRRQHRYETEGWGLCFDGTALAMSDGTDALVFRDPSTFAERRRVQVRLEGRPVTQLNELECVGEHVYANVWQTDEIVRIVASTGVVDQVIDASGLLDAEQRYRTDVLNGIAYVPETRRFLITGKLWPRMFEVTFEAVP